MKYNEYRSTFLVIAGVFAATFTGFLRQSAIAHQLGAGRLADVFLVAYAVPEFVYIALPIILIPAFLPIFVQYRQKNSDRSAWDLALSTSLGLLGILLGLTVIAYLIAPAYIGWLSPGFTPDERRLAIQATQWMLPAICLMGLTTVMGTILQVYGRFGPSALATAVFNGVFIVILFATPIGQPLDRAAWAVLIGALAAFLFQLPLLKKYFPAHLQISNPFRHLSSLKPVALLAGPLTVGYAVHHLILFIDRAMATSLGAGAAASISYADRLGLVIGQLSGLAISTVLFPRLAEEIGKGELVNARRSLAGALRLVCLLAVPASAGLILLRVPVVQVLFERGAFGHEATLAVSNVLVWYTLSNLADAICQPFWRVIYAQRRVWSVLAINGAQTGLRIVANILLIQYFGVTGLGISAFLGLAFQAALLFILVQKQIGNFLEQDWWRGAAQIGSASLVAVSATWILVVRLSSLSSMFLLAIAGVSGGLIYFFMLRIPAQILSLVRRGVS